MPRIATDDDARRQRFVWLGPVNSPWPFEAQGRSWVMALVICPPLIILTGIPTWALLSPITSTPAAVIITGTIALAGGTALGVRAVTILSRTISDTRPLRHLVWTLIAEADAPRPQEPTVWAMDDPTRLDAARDGARVRVITADHLFED